MNMNDESLPATGRWPKHALWLGPVITLVGALSYFLVFFQFPILRDFPVLNLPVVLLGFALSVAGCWEMFRSRSGLLGKTFASGGMLLSLAIAGLFCFYIFFLSYQLPAGAAVPNLQAAAPEFALLDQNGEQVQLSDFLGSKVILVFYRGHW